MPDISIDYDALRRMAGDLRRKQQELIQKMESLQNQVNNLITGEFKTDVASAKLGDAQTRFTQNAKKALEALDRMAQYLERVIQQQTELDQNLGSGFSAIK
jgi:uncharacterized protein YukE